MGTSRKRNSDRWISSAGLPAKAAALILALCALVYPPSSRATEKPGDVPIETGVTEKLGQQVDLAREFTNHTGKVAPFGESFRPGRPAILLPVYFRCPRLCKLNRSGAVELIKQLDLKLGDEISVISASFNPDETSDDAVHERQSTIDQLGPEFGPALEKPQSWSFLVGGPTNSKDLMDEIGFRFKRDGDEFSHPATLIILTPEGKISRYFYDLKNNPQDVRLSLVEASHGGIGSTIDHILLFCFRFDPTRGKYSLLVMNLVRIVSVGIAAILIGLLAYMRRREVKNRNTSS